VICSGVDPNNKIKVYPYDPMIFILLSFWACRDGEIFFRFLKSSCCVASFSRFDRLVSLQPRLLLGPPSDAPTRAKDLAADCGHMDSHSRGKYLVWGLTNHHAFVAHFANP
jgi:hypothetical protein